MAQLLRVETKPCLSLGPESGPKNPKIISEFEKLATGDNQTYIGCGKKMTSVLYPRSIRYLPQVRQDGGSCKEVCLREGKSYIF